MAASLMPSAWGDVLLRLDIHRHLAQVQLIQPLEDGHADAGPSDEHLALLLQAGDDVGLIGGCLDIAGENDGQDSDHGHHNGDDGRDGDVFWHGDSSFQCSQGGSFISNKPGAA